LLTLCYCLNHCRDKRTIVTVWSTAEGGGDCISILRAQENFLKCSFSSHIPSYSHFHHLDVVCIKNTICARSGSVQTSAFITVECFLVFWIISVNFDAVSNPTRCHVAQLFLFFSFRHIHVQDEYSTKQNRKCRQIFQYGQLGHERVRECITNSRSNLSLTRSVSRGSFELDQSDGEVSFKMNYVIENMDEEYIMHIIEESHPMGVRLFPSPDQRQRSHLPPFFFS
jgi:hypothetical protein